MRVFWEKPEYDPLRLKDISEDEIKKVEKKLNLTLPQQYKKLIIQQNGGLINFNAFPTNQETSCADDHIEVDHIRGIEKDLGILESEYLIKEWGLPQKLLLIQEMDTIGLHWIIAKRMRIHLFITLTLN